MTNDLFDELAADADLNESAPQQNPALHQWFTPAWAAQAIVEQEFAWLSAGHRVLEPSCGDGSFLVAISPEIEAIGIEIDPAQARAARANSGRAVIEGDFLQCDLSQLGQFDAIISNPPFSATLVAGFVERSVGLLREGGQAGFILPAYITQTSSKVELLSKHFSIHQQQLPRNLFPGLKLPLIFARFVKEQNRRLFGFLLYREAQDIGQLAKPFRAVANSSRNRRGAWFEVVSTALATLGGEADLSRIYETVSKNRPTENQFWRQKIRQVLQRSNDFTRTAPGRYSLASAV